jgi:BMFP domain-containing protein YqiC
MQTDNKFFDDLSRVAGGAIGTLAGLGREMEARLRERMEQFVGGLDLVKRDEFEAVKAMATEARTQADALAARVAALEATLAGAAAAPAPEAKPKPARKPRAPKA